MQEKEDEERAIYEEKAFRFLLNRSARRIQRCWRAYRERKKARRRGRKCNLSLLFLFLTFSTSSQERKRWEKG